MGNVCLLQELVTEKYQQRTCLPAQLEFFSMLLADGHQAVSEIPDLKFVNKMLTTWKQVPSYETSLRRICTEIFPETCVSVWGVNPCL